MSIACRSRRAGRRQPTTSSATAPMPKTPPWSRASAARRRRASWRAACLPVIKHMPGHGRAGADSHHDLPVVDASLEALDGHDFAPFRMLADMPMAMTAHVVFTALDPQGIRPRPRASGRARRSCAANSASTACDDRRPLDEGALGQLREKSRAAIRPGCDVVLHCNGIMEEMIAVAGAVPELDGGTAPAAPRWRSPRIRHEPEPFDPVEAAAPGSTRRLRWAADSREPAFSGVTGLGMRRRMDADLPFEDEASAGAH